jgi:hypothetical protein
MIGGGKVGLGTIDFVIPEEGLLIHLRGYGWITVFKFVGTNGRIDYIATNKENTNRQEVETLIRARWCVEVYHREIKQTCDVLTQESSASLDSSYISEASVDKSLNESLLF